MIPSTARALVCVSLLAASAPAMAATLRFDPLAPSNAATPLPVTAGSLTATFTSPSGAGAFIAEDGSAFSTLGSAVLADDNFTHEELDIAFNQVLSTISFGFATNDLAAATPVTLTERLRGQAVGSQTATGTLAASGLPEGVLSLFGASFDSVSVTDTDPGNAGFAIGAVTVPEPPAVLLLLSAMLGLTVLRRRGS